jgi:ABC-type lipoprotein release transport system permease subunit
MLLITSSLKYELNDTYQALPEIILQKSIGGRVQNISNSSQMINQISKIAGIEQVKPRVWGYYYFKNAGVNLSILGVDIYEEYQEDELKSILNSDIEDKLSDDEMIVGLGVKEAFAKSFYDKYFNFILPNGELKRVNITSTFSSSTRLFSNDVVLLNIDIAKEILGLNEDECSDIIIKVSNKLEINNIKAKLTALYPNSKIISKEDIISANGSLFDYKSGLFLMMIVIALFTFFMIIYDKSSSVMSEQKEEIAILKAVGWKIEDVIKLKFYESFIISFVSFLAGVSLAIFYVFWLQAPILADIFSGYSMLKAPLQLHFYFDIASLFLLFFITVIIYISATIIPSWKIATIDTGEIIK